MSDTLRQQIRNAEIDAMVSGSAERPGPNLASMVATLADARACLEVVRYERGGINRVALDKLLGKLKDETHALRQRAKRLNRVVQEELKRGSPCHSNRSA